MTGRTDEWTDVISRLRIRLLELLREPEKGSQTVANALEDLERLGDIHRSTVHKAGPERTLRRRKGGQGKTYRIEQARRGPALTEYFAAGRPPFRCSMDVYQKVADVLLEQDAPATFEEILQKVRRVTRRDLPDYLVRTCMRFWLSRQPPLLEKMGARYRPVPGVNLRREARNAWRALSESVK